MSHALTKQRRLEQAKRLLLIHQTGLSDTELAQALDVRHNTAWRYRRELGAVPVSKGRFRLIPTEADVELAQAIVQASQQGHRPAREIENIIPQAAKDPLHEN